VRPILHVSQIASVLGLPRPPGGEKVRLGWELASALDEWLECLRSLDWGALTAPTASRGRSLRNLTVNVFHPVGLLPVAWTTGRFDWDPDGDAEREAALGDAEEVVGYTERIAAGWTSFLLDSETDLHERDPEVLSPRGRVTYSELMASQVWHAQFHLRQITSESPSA
jgi:hypothetical protein